MSYVASLVAGPFTAGAHFPETLHLAGRLRPYLLLFAVLSNVACTADPGYRGKSSDEMIAELRSGTRENQIDAAFGLKKVLEVRSDYPAVVKALSEALRDTSDAVRLAAAHALTVPGVNIEPALSGIHAALHDTAHARTRRTITMTIGTLGPSRAAPLVPALLEGLHDPSSEVREAAVEALGVLAPPGADKLAAVATLAVDSSARVRRSVFHALISMHAKPEAFLGITRHAVADTSSAVREAAILLLATFGRSASVALPELERALLDHDERVVLAALHAIESIGVPAIKAQGKLAALAANRSLSVSTAASRALASVKGRPLPPPQFEEPAQR